MTTERFISYLQSLHVRLWVEGDHLKYKAPVGTITASLRDEIVQRKAEITRFLSAANAVGNHGRIVRIPAKCRSSPPLSFAQERLWFLDQFISSGSAYNVHRALRLKGRLDISALRLAVNEVVRRHEILRTTFQATNANPIQRVAPTHPMLVPVTDLSALPVEEREAKALRLATERAEEPFDLARGPLFRVTVLRFEYEDHVILVDMHHIIVDEWSLGILTNEISLLYESFSKGRPALLPELPIQYVDFSIWQREWLQGEVLETQLSYWKRQLNGVPPVLELPTDNQRPAVQTFRGGLVPVEIPKSLADAVKALGQDRSITLFMKLLAAFQTLLYRYTNQSDVVVGSPISNRDRPETEDLVGLFLNTLVLRSDLSGDPRFTELLERVREMALEAYTHRDLPFEKLVEVLQPERDLSRTPIFQVLFSLVSAPEKALELQGLTVNSMQTVASPAQFDLSLHIREEPDELRGMLQFNTDLFEVDTIDRMVVHFLSLLKGIVADPERRLSELSMLTYGEQQQLLVEFNDTEESRAISKCIHELFEEQVERSPDAIALVFEDTHVTYNELNCRANQLAHYLKDLGVGPEVLVGLCVERSLEMVIGMLGILKAGGAYVPLDPAYPEERLVFMLEDAQVQVILTQEGLIGRLPKAVAPIVSLDRVWANVGRLSGRNPNTRTFPLNRVYVIYTSGSTGTPKGVTISHDAVANLVCFMSEKIAIAAEDKLLAVTSLSFDIAALEVFLPLTAGARLIIADGDSTRDMKRLLKSLVKSRATIMQATPTTWQTLLKLGLGNCVEMHELRVLCGGDDLSSVLASQLFDCGSELWNLYGPTETTIWSSVYKIESRDSHPLIGYPLANTQIHIVDADMNLVPVKIAGQMLIGGDGLARGYHRRPELTAERFIPNPFASEPGDRLYVTGDLARRLQGGAIKFLERKDQQVKIRGHRIELGDIEAALRRHPGVDQSLVVTREDSSGQSLLVAYVTSGLERGPSANELRRHLRDKLPAYMVPSYFLLLHSLPVGLNGKLDRKALPTPDYGGPLDENSYVAPHSAKEQEIAEIWREVLGVRKVGIHDNFFELGGHSLAASILASRLSDTFHVRVSLRSIFEHPTVLELAELIDVLDWLQAEQPTSLEGLFSDRDGGQL